jgi:hypothetical protein
MNGAAKLYDILSAGAGESSQGRTPVDNATVRSVFVTGLGTRIKLILPIRSRLREFP